jgi:hypothetical protein
VERPTGFGAVLSFVILLFANPHPLTPIDYLSHFASITLAPRVKELLQSFRKAKNGQREQASTLMM